ncbi:tRNA pseudouridine(13) synthase TruD [Arsenophonus nasoniae]|uniref:tRNA pseudouridine synthase D n=1 Tax=Arsenophonus nasoniae TaxID=638 RepID=A0AA95GD59_9GAMM|nr:tRNA pseudouridine(13) synthase TruD [Arsenophonus nasoniae]WGL94895.1 tRNA pseudouridine(13) synthase TruD [Arsenophonus nasoniae]WGM02176.1 tRNA pseudouridine(13) synthase TruD [Arsenophonus nasoniae]
MTVTALQWLHGKPVASGAIKLTAEDFIVRENLGFLPEGEGEHLMVYVRKKGCNTQFVAEQLARFVGISPRSVSYAGLKDRQAVTEQWFCLHLPGKEDPDINQFSLAGCEILLAKRQKRKLRIGSLKGNDFEITLRQISDQRAVETRLQQIKILGVANYFGEQRFGRAGNNLVQAERWAKGEIEVKQRNKRSFYLSAVRSVIFNFIVSERILNNKIHQIIDGDVMQLTGSGSWFVAKREELPQLQERLQAGAIQITAPLYGEKELGTQSVAKLFEQQCLTHFSVLLPLLQAERTNLIRRAIIVVPQNMHWEWLEKQTLKLSFSLPKGSFATSVIRELINQSTKNIIDIDE